MNNQASLIDVMKAQQIAYNQAMFKFMNYNVITPLENYRVEVVDFSKPNLKVKINWPNGKETI